MKNTKTVLITMLAAAGFVQAARALPTAAGLYLVDTETGDTAFVADGPSGIAEFTGALGDYKVNISATGTTITAGGYPALDLDVANSTAGAGATTLQVYYSNGSFGPTAGTYTLATSGPASGGPITSSAYMGSTFFDTSTMLASSVDSYPFTMNGSAPLNSSSYYLTLEDVITGTEVSVDSHFSTVVPEPSTVFLGLTGLGMAMVAYRRRS